MSDLLPNICPICGQPGLAVESRTEIEAGYAEVFNCPQCGEIHTWTDTPIIVDEDDQDDQDDQEPPGLPYLYGDGVYTSARPFRIVRRNDDYGH